MALLNLQAGELAIVLLVAILVFGKRLPQVAGQAASQVTRVRRALEKAWRDTGMDRELHQMRRDIDTAIPRDLSIGEMARLASAEMDRRIRENESPEGKEPAREEPASGEESRATREAQASDGDAPEPSVPRS